MNPKDFDPGPLADVECRRDGDRWTLIFVRHLRHAPAKVWGALTEAAQLRQWAPFQPDRDLATPGPAKLAMTAPSPIEPVDSSTTSGFLRRLGYAWSPPNTRRPWLSIRRCSAPQNGQAGSSRRIARAHAGQSMSCIAPRYQNPAAVRGASSRPRHGEVREET